MREPLLPSSEAVGNHVARAVEAWRRQEPASLNRYSPASPAQKEVLWLSLSGSAVAN